MRCRDARLPFLRRHPRLRRALTRARVFRATLRPGGARQALPLFVALGSLLAAALLLSAASGLLPGARAPEPDGSPTRTPSGRPTAGAAPSATPGGSPVRPTEGDLPTADASPSEAPLPEGATAAAPKGVLPGVGTDCSTGSAGARALEPLRTEASLAASATVSATRLDALREAMSGTPYAFADLALDPATGVRAFVLAKTQAGADNLNGFFYFLYDPSAPASGIAPLVAVVDRLFTESDRTRALADRTYATPAVEAALRAAFEAVLGTGEGREASDFVLALYRAAFAARADGAPPVETRRYLALRSATVVFQDSYMTYVELLPGGAP